MLCRPMPAPTPSLSLSGKHPLLAQLAVVSRLTLTPLPWDTVMAACDPLLPDDSLEYYGALRSNLTHNQARHFNKAIAAHFLYAIAELPQNGSPGRRLPANYQPPERQSQDNPPGGRWRLLIPLGSLEEHKDNCERQQEKLIALRRAVKEGLETTARQLYLKTPESLTRLASRMTMSVEYRALSRPQDNPPRWDGIDYRELERELQLEFRQRFPARLPPGLDKGAAAP